jgi:hypothetical protein
MHAFIVNRDENFLVSSHALHLTKSNSL